MVSKFSFFAATAQYNVMRFLPGKKQEFLECLEEISENVPGDFFCQDILEVWAENFGIIGLLLGSIALFGIGLVLMAAADHVICRTDSGLIASALRFLSGVYCFEKFKGNSRRTLQDVLILLYTGVSVVSGFQWTVTMLVLVLFLNDAAYASKGGRLC